MRKITWIYCISSLLCWTNLFWIFYVFFYPNNIPIVPSEQKVIKNLYEKIRTLKQKNEAADGAYTSACNGCDKKVAAILNEKFRFFILNLDRRPDKLHCVQKQLSKFGIRASRLPGVDSMSFGVDDAKLLPAQVKTFLHKIDPTKRGHVGCLYGHVNFLLTAASGEASCGNPPDQGLRTISGFSENFFITFRNRMKKDTASVYFVDRNGQNKKFGDIKPGAEKSFPSKMMQAWRVKRGNIQIMEFRLDGTEVSAKYELDILGKTAVAHIFDCSSSSAAGNGNFDNRVSILFEDDVILRNDFAEKLLWMHEKVTETEGKDNWDIMLLNWYCNNVHWKQCNRNSVGYSAKIASIPFTPNDKQLYDYTTKNKGGVDEFSIVPVQMFMSGSAYAVNRKSANKLLDTFPCDSHFTHEACSMAVDWHYSTLVKAMNLKVFGASPPFVLMPGMGSVQTLNIRKPPKSKTDSLCGVYHSDTDFKELGRASPKSMVENRLELWRRKNRIKYPKGNTIGKYTAYDKSMLWKDAEQACQAKGQHLVTIKNVHENEQVEKLVKNTCGHVKSAMNGWDLCAWIGLNDYAKEGVLVWSSGYSGKMEDGAFFQNFLSGEPNNMNNQEDGMALCWNMDGGKWIDFSNNGELPCYVCEV
jgi:GR25 family glycosyltransferase involved in LPS biosynthesis